MARAMRSQARSATAGTKDAVGQVAETCQMARAARNGEEGIQELLDAADRTRSHERASE